MNAAGRLAAYGAGLAVVFGVAFATSGALAPGEAAGDPAPGTTAHGAHADDDAPADAGGNTSTPGLPEPEVSGVSIARSGFTFGAVDAPAAVGQDGTLSFQVLDASGDPVTEFETAHDKDLHLIAVRTDGTGYRHVHPELDTTTGTWSLPWTWDAAGTYRLYADFTVDGTNAVLTRSVDVAGELDPAPPSSAVTTAHVDGFDVTVSGDLVAGTASELTIEVSRDGEPVTGLEPYLGAFGHLVALREGDLAYLHVHAHGDKPEPGDLAGPEVVFTAEAPTAGRYLLYLDFQVDGEVRTAELVLDATAPSGPSASGGADEHDDGADDGHGSH